MSEPGWLLPTPEAQLKRLVARVTAQMLVIEVFVRAQEQPEVRGRSGEAQRVVLAGSLETVVPLVL